MHCYSKVCSSNQMHKRLSSSASHELFISSCEPHRAKPVPIYFPITEMTDVLLGKQSFLRIDSSREIPADYVLPSNTMACQPLIGVTTQACPPPPHNAVHGGKERQSSGRQLKNILVSTRCRRRTAAIGRSLLDGRD